MEIATDSISLVISDLIERKSKRDDVKFTSSQLAQAINVERSIIHRLIHSDPRKRVTNPKIETLIKIVEYFRAEGFEISIDGLLTTKRHVVDVQEQIAGTLSQQASIPLYWLNNPKAQNLGTINLSMAEHSGSVIALLSEEDIKPMFKKGSIFIIDPNLSPEDNTLVAVKIGDQSKTLIRKYYIEDNIAILRSYDPSDAVIKITPDVKCEIIGVVIQANVKT